MLIVSVGVSNALDSLHTEAVMLSGYMKKTLIRNHCILFSVNA